MQNKDSVNILFIGDIVGKPGRFAVADYLNKTDNKYDFIIANVENASHGFGLTEKNYHELSELGISAFTSGNHIWDKKVIFEYIHRADKLIRPLNYPKGLHGEGYRIFDVGDFKIGVINLLGRVFMGPIDSPWTVLEDVLEKIKKETDIILVDFHAEATAEKISFGYYADSLGVSAVIGTHTHIQTADEKILTNGTAYITDVGFCGASNGVIGMDIETSMKRLITSLPERFEVAPLDKVELNGVEITVNKHTGRALSITRFKHLVEFNNEVKE